MSDPVLEALVEKYDGRIPRYTSYPTAAELVACDDIGRVHRALRESSGENFAMYVHLPFCRSLCWFCACNKIVTQDQSVVAPYLTDLQSELDILKSHFGRRPHVASVHFGGGSPTFLSDGQMNELALALDERVEGFDKAEKSIELDPRTTTREQIERLAQHGFTRASLGVQDFEPVVQALVHRVQPYEMVREVVELVRTNGFESLNFDLIYGLPGQTVESVRRTARAVVDLRPDRIALFGYAHVSWKIKTQRVFDKHGLPSSVERIRLFEAVEEVLLEGGYIPVGLDHFALPDDALIKHGEEGTLSRNFMGYTTIGESEVLAIGVSSISDVGNLLYQNHTDLEQYFAAVRAGRLPVAKIRERTREDVVRGHLITRMMCDGEIRYADIPLHMEEEARVAIRDADSDLMALERDGLIVRDRERIRATFYGRHFLRSLASVFDTYLKKSEQAFSSAV